MLTAARILGVFGSAVHPPVWELTSMSACACVKRRR